MQHQAQVRQQASASIAVTDRTTLALLASLAFAIATVVALGSASAQNADAEALFNEAEALETAGKIPEACDAFEASNRIEPRAGTLIRLGQCRETQTRLVSAWSAYKDALTRAKDPAKRQLAEQRVAALEPRLSYLTVLVPDESRIDGLVIKRNGKELDAALWNRAAPVDGGVYTISGSAPGHEEWSTTVEVAVESDKASIEVPRFKELRKLVENPQPDGGGGGGGGGGGNTDTPPPSAFTGKRKAALGVGGVGVLALAGGLVMGMQAKGLEDEALMLCPNPATPCANAAQAQDKHDSGRSKALLANIGIGVGVAAVAGAAVLWFTGAPKAASSERVGVHPTLSPAYSGVDVVVRF
jgi:tetratricopeptide (TPR) repeat protein